MKVCFICGYYSDLAHKHVRRTEIYWDAYFFVWAVKVGSFRRPFNIHFKNEILRIDEANFARVRPTFGRYVVSRITEEGLTDPLLVSVPSKDGVISSTGFRSSTMLKQAMAGTQYEDHTLDALTWTQSLKPAREGGPRDRETLKAYLHVDPAVRGRSVVLIDDVLSTGGSMLAARDRLEEEGAQVIGAVTCGRTIYDFDTKAFGRQEIILDQEIADYGKVSR